MSCLVCLGCHRGNGVLVPQDFKSRNGRKVAGKLSVRVGVSNRISTSEPQNNFEKLPSFLDEKVKELVKNHTALMRQPKRRITYKMIDTWDLDEAYDRCLELAGQNFLSNTASVSYHPLVKAALSFLVARALSFFPPNKEHLKSLSAIAVWFRKIDQLVDGNNGSYTTLQDLDRWEQRLMDTIQGHPSDVYDAALFDTMSKYSIDLQLFKDFLEGMRLDLTKSRYENIDELDIYAYHAAGTPLLISVQLLGITMESKASLEGIYNSVLSFALAGQLVDILADISEDAKMGRIYLPQDELAFAGLSDDDVFTGRVTDKWRDFMKGQIKRARMRIEKGEKVFKELPLEDRIIWQIAASLLRQILDGIEANDYSSSKKVSFGIENVLLSFLRVIGLPFKGLML